METLGADPSKIRTAVSIKSLIAFVQGTNCHHMFLTLCCDIVGHQDGW